MDECRLYSPFPAGHAHADASAFDTPLHWSPLPELMFPGTLTSDFPMTMLGEEDLHEGPPVGPAPVLFLGSVASAPLWTNASQPPIATTNVAAEDGELEADEAVTAPLALKGTHP